MENEIPIGRRLAYAMDLYFDYNMTQKDATEQANVSVPMFQKELREHRLCYHPDCSEYHPCRCAKRLNKGRMVCSLLTDTDFGWRDCPFFKTEFKYDKEYEQTNKLTDIELMALGYLRKE